MIFFPLALVVAVVIAFRGRLAWAVTAGAALFVVAVLLAWQVQGFPPSPRDLAWLVLVLLAAWGSWRIGGRAGRGVTGSPR